MTESTNPTKTRRHSDIDAGTTLDLRQAWPPRTVTTRRPPWYQTPAAEVHVQTRGRWMIYSGVTLGAFTFLFAVAWRQLSGGRVMPIEYMLPLYALAFGAVSVGLLEYLSRGQRYQAELALDQTRAVEQELTRVRADIGVLVGLMDEELQQRYYRGIHDHARIMQATGTDTGRPTGRARNTNGEVRAFRSKR